MPISSHYVREGETEPISVNLQDNGVNLDISGYTGITLFLRAKNKEKYPNVTVVMNEANNKLSVTSAANGAIDILPAETDFEFQYGDYLGYFIVVDASSKRISIPDEDDILFIVLERYRNDT